MFVIHVCGGGIKKDRTGLLMFGGYGSRKLRVIHEPFRKVHHHRVGGVTTTSAWAGLGVNFGNPYMEAILNYGVPRAFNTS